ncbi:hypothetical protein Dda_5504 [Drechslerella dactyloides]|uniref:DH domain-containing protein n=1 Tax=Drechslerella dactyloides TaxID=74499 RepID=A0AAD6IYF4_DREDA|nr:hypothetical protein Dda_5504 [Drechslerella dactyloides]
MAPLDMQAVPPTDEVMTSRQNSEWKNSGLPDRRNRTNGLGETLHAKHANPFTSQMSSGVTASAADERPKKAHMNGATPNLALSTNIPSSASNALPDESAVSSPASSSSPTATRTVVKQRSASHSLRPPHTNGTSSSSSSTSSRRSNRSASANPREFNRTTGPRKPLEVPSTNASRLQSKPSFQDIIKRFNDQPDETLPVPKTRSASLSSSRCASPVRPKSALANHTRKQIPTASKPSSSRSSTTTQSKLNTSSRDRRNSGSSTSSYSRGRRASTRSVPDSNARSATPADSSTSTVISDNETRPTAKKKSSIPKLKPPPAPNAQSTPPISPISPVDPTRKSRLYQGASGSRIATTAGARQSVPKPINTRTSSTGKTGPLKSPSLNAYIKPSDSQKSPALRSSRPRLPVASVKNAHPTRSGMTETSSSSTSRMNGRATRAVSTGKDNKDSKESKDNKDDTKPKKKIPELGTVDFAARRKLIASAFNDRMEKEREERNRAHQKKEREAAAKKKQLEAEARRAAAAAEAFKQEESVSPTSKPTIGLGLDLGDAERDLSLDNTPLNEPISVANATESAEPSPVNIENYELPQNAPPTENENSTQIPHHTLSERPLSRSGHSPRSPKLPGKPDEYKRSPVTPSSPYEVPTNNRHSRQMFTEADDRATLASPIAEPASHDSHEVLPESPRAAPPKLLIPGIPVSDEGGIAPDTLRELLFGGRPLSPIQGSPSGRSEDWEKAVEEEKRRRKEIEQDREMKLKNRLSTPVTPKGGSPLLDNDATPRGYTHKKQSSWSASPHLAPPDSLGHIMWKFRPLSTGGESMIDNFYKEQEELSLARRRKQELMRFVEPESPADDYTDQGDKGKGVQRYELHDKEYPTEMEEGDGVGYVHIAGTYRYSASTVNSSVRSRSVDPNDYWTPQPSIGEFEGNPPRESWATDSTMTSYSTSSGLAPNGSFSRKILERERPISETPPTPPPKDFIFSPKNAPSIKSIKSVASDTMPPPPAPQPPTIAARRSSVPTDNNVEPLRIVKPPVLQQQDVYESPISIRSTNSLIPEPEPEPQDEAPEHSDRSPSSEYSEEEASDQSSQTRGSAALGYAEGSPNTSMITTSGSFVSTSQDPQVVEKKLLTKRRFLLRELVDTEKTFFQDMTVTEEIYKGTTDACDDLKAEDVRILFGNTHAVVAFSRGFFETLKAAVASVYIPTKTKTPSGSQVDINDTTNGDPDLVEPSEEADRKTWVGDAFAQALPNMEKVFGDYCKNHESAVSRLQALEKVRGVAIWLKVSTTNNSGIQFLELTVVQECKTVADDLTHAWSLESLLIKPVQRLLKYPLLLDQILDCTPANHPDREAIELVNKEIRFVTERINESKKRKDLMDKLVGPRKKADNDLRHGLTKGWQRRAEKLRQTVGLSEMPHDQRYENATSKFREQYFKLQLVSKDIEMYLNDVDKQVADFGVLAVKFEDLAACSPTRFKEYEERWQTFTKRTKEMKEVALVEHRLRIKRHVLTPLETALKMCENPQKVMLKREKKAVDFARFRALKEKGDRIDKKTKDLADAYLAVNETLLDELPRLHTLIESLVGAVLCNFAEVCGIWEKYWAGRLEGLLDPLDIPSNFSDIIEVYRSDFTKVESVVESLTITNTNADMWKTYSVYSQSSTGSHPETASIASQSLYRSNTADGAVPSPNPSTLGRNSIGGSSTPNRLSGSFSPGTALVAASLGHALPMLPGAMVPPQSSQRGRASSAFNIPPTRAPPPPPIRALSSASVPAHVPSHSPGLSPTLSTHSVPQSAASAPLVHPSLPAIQGLDSNSPSPSRPSTSSDATGRTVLGYPVLWLCASIYSYHASKEADSKRDMGFAYLTYDQGEIFDVIGTKGEYWLARNQDDNGQEFGWIWSKHFARLALD